MTNAADLSTSVHKGATRARTAEETAWYKALWIIHDNAVAGCVVPAMEYDHKTGQDINRTPPEVMRVLRRNGWVRTTHEGRLAWVTEKGLTAMWALDGGVQNAPWRRR